VLLKVAYAGVNRPDILQRQGRYNPPPGHSTVLGLEVSGTVVSLGPAVEGLAIGDKVCALVNGGGYAEYCTAPQGSCLPIPKGLALSEAACVPETFFTVWANVFADGGLPPGGVFLVHGGAGGIGTAAIQMARGLCGPGATIFTTAGSDDRCRRCEGLGADLAVNYRTHDFAAAVKERLGKGRGVDVVLDLLGGPAVQQNLSVMAPQGRHVSVAFLQGARAEVDIMLIMSRRLILTGSTLRSRTDEAKAGFAAALRKHVWPLVEAGTVRPVVDLEVPFADAAEAHRRLDAGDVFGKVVIAVDPAQA